MSSALATVLAVAESDAPAAPSNVGLGSVVLTIVLGAFLAWIGYLVIASRRRRRVPEETPKNLQPYLSDEELEAKRVTRVLGAAVLTAAVLALLIPVYYVLEADRQASAAEAIGERDVEEGEHWYEKFECTTCHGPTGGGGGAPYTERRSDLGVSWAAPSINDVLYRYSEEEIRDVIVWGRAGTPMAPAGLEGGGSMTQQEIDQVIAYLEHIQVTQDEALLKIEGRVQGALDRIIDGENRVELAILEQTAERDDILAADGILEEHRAFLAASPALRGDRLDDAVRTLLSADGTCTDESAALAGTTCDVAGADADRDGITDDAERALTAVAEHALETLTSRSVQAVVADDGTASNEIVVSSNEAYDVTFDPGAGFSNTSVTGEPIADFVELEAFLETLDTDLLTTVLISERLDTFLGGVDGRLAFLRASLAQRRWIPDGVTVSDGSADFGELASRMGTDEAGAERAVGLYNGYCARCHTGGYSAGVATEQEPGSGAWAPALRDGRSTVQFPDAEDQVGFIIRGSEFGVNYGVNGLGNGKMPGFGQILSLEDIELIVAFERSL